MGPAVVCLHGLTRNLLDFEDLAPRIAGLGRRVITVSQRGRGTSDYDPAPERYVLSTYTADLKVLLDTFQLDQAVLVGTSMGGLMTLMLALEAPTRIAGAVLNDIGPQIDPKGLARIADYVKPQPPAASWAEAAARSRAVHHEAFPHETEDPFWRDFARRTYRETPSGGVALNYDPQIITTMSTVSGPSVDWWAALDALAQAPTLVVRGALSDILSADTATAMTHNRRLVRLVEAANVGHAPFLTEDDVWPHLAQFLGDLHG